MVLPVLAECILVGRWVGIHMAGVIVCQSLLAVGVLRAIFLRCPGSALRLEG
jgi:hypothetical protein